MDVTPVLSLPINKFRSEIDDFDDWIHMFEKTVDMCHNTADANRRQELYRNWLPLKLDDKARLTHSGITGANWAEIKTEFKKALIDPQDEYNWRARRMTIIWDGIESFQALATRVKRSVDKYDEECVKEREYFFRFRLALPPDYRRAIDIGCAKERRNIDEARSIAERIHLANAEAGDTAAAPASAAASHAPTPTFTGATMSEDRLRSLEVAVQEMSVRMEDLVSSRARRDVRGSRHDLSPDYRGHHSEGHSRDHDRRRHDDSRDSWHCHGDRRDNHAWDGDRKDRHYVRYRYDDRDQHNYEGRASGRGHNDYDSYHHSSYDSQHDHHNRDRFEGRDRYDDRDYEHDRRDHSYDGNGRNNYNR